MSQFYYQRSVYTFFEDELVNTITQNIRYVIHLVIELYTKIPGHQIITKYIVKSYQNDPFRIFLECILVIFALNYLFQRRYSVNKTLDITLTENEIEELITDWTPKPLVPNLPQPETCKEILGPVCARPVTSMGKVLNFANFNFLDIADTPAINAKAIKTVKGYGVGACGPPGFYGTLDVHLELEKRIADFLGTESAIIYAQGFSAVSSVVPAFSKRQDYIVCDDGVSFGLQKGVQISRSRIKYFKHNDMSDLVKVLEEIEAIERKKKTKPLPRKFIVSEGLFMNFGDIAPLPKLIEIKKKYKYRLILDESSSIGALGSRGAGLCDFYSIQPSEVDIIVGSMANAFGSAGGFCAGSIHVTDHQRLSGQAYCFSAALPALLAVSATEAINIADQGNASPVHKLSENIRFFRSEADKKLPKNSKIGLFGDIPSPIIHFRFKPGNRLESAESEKRILQKIVDYCHGKNVLVTMAKYVENQELSPAYTTFWPSIRIIMSSAFNVSEITALLKALNGAIKEYNLLE